MHEADKIPVAGSRVAPSGEWPVFRDPRFMLLLRHWADKRIVDGRVGLTMPRDALDPAAIRSCLPNVWLFQYEAENDSFICRLSGEAVNEAWGVRMAGKRPSEYMPPESAALAHQIYRHILFTPALHTGHRRILPSNRQEKGADRLVVPLSNADGSPYGIFGLSLYHFDPITEAGLLPHVTPDVTFYPCAALPADMP